MKAYGMTDFGKKVIKVNKAKSKKGSHGEVMDSIFHEETHAKHPKMHEKTVRKVTQAMLPTLSAKQRQKYYSMYK